MIFLLIVLLQYPINDNHIEWPTGREDRQNLFANMSSHLCLHIFELKSGNASVIDCKLCKKSAINQN